MTNKGILKKLNSILYGNVLDLKCDVFKVPHHGGYFLEGTNTVSLGQVIDCSNPKFVIIYTGQNDNYKHPSRETIEYRTGNFVEPNFS